MAKSLDTNIDKLKAVASGDAKPRGLSFSKQYDVDLQKIEEGFIEGTFIVKSKYLNGIKTMHGGGIASLADEWSGLAGYTLGISGKLPTVTLTINFLLPLREDDVVTLQSRVIKRGKRMLYVEVAFYVKGRIAVKATGTHFIIKNQS